LVKNYNLIAVVKACYYWSCILCNTHFALHFTRFFVIARIFYSIVQARAAFIQATA